MSKSLSTRSKVGGIPPPKKLRIDESQNQSSYPDVADHPALSNYVILKQIFGNLSYPDLVSCCNVSPVWMNIAGPMINHYIVSLKAFSRGEEVSLEDIVGFPTIYRSREVSREELEGILVSARDRLPISLELNLNIYVSTETKQSVLTFLSQFGCSIHVLSLTVRPELEFKTFLKYLSYCPNLQVLCLDIEFEEEANNCQSDFVLPDLLDIRFYKSLSKYACETIFRIALNVKSLRVDDSDMLRTIATCGKIGAVNTWSEFVYSGNNPKQYIIMNEVYKHLRHASDHGVRLTSIVAPNFYHLLPKSKRQRKVTAGKVKSEFHRILEASKDTLEVLTIPPAKSSDYYYPTPFQMTSVKLLIFEGKYDYFKNKFNIIFRADSVSDYDVFSESESDSGSEVNVYSTLPRILGISTFKSEGGRQANNASTSVRNKNEYFPNGTNLEQLFPNLEALNIDINYGRNAIAAFPKDTLNTPFLKRVVSKLKIGRPRNVRIFTEFYPNVTHLVISQYCLKRLIENFPTICKRWPKLKVFKVFLKTIWKKNEGEYRSSSHSSRVGLECSSTHLTLDSSFTGLPEDICSRLYRGCQLEEILSDDEITELRSNNPSLFQLKYLENMDIIVEDSRFICNNVCGNSCPGFITPVTAYAALNHLPRLTLSVRTWRGRHTDFREVRKALEPILEFIRLDNNYTDPVLPFQ